MNGTKTRILRRIAAVFLILALSGAAACGVLVLWAVSSAPALTAAAVSPHGYRTAVLDRDGEVMRTLAGEEANRVYVTLDNIPKHLQNAFIAIEDQRFYSHKGVDLRGVARALVQNIRSGSLSQGGSTLTQQLIKNNVFAAGMRERTPLDRIKRKLQEQYLAFLLERSETKAWILENYLNTINLGGGTWGVQTAAQRYFGKEVSELTLAECAAIAGITQSPSAYNPLRHPEANRERQMLVLSRMRDLGLINYKEYEDAVSADIYTGLRENAAAGTEEQAFSWFEDAAVSQAAEDLQTELGYSEAEAWKLLYRGGLTLETTQDTDLQRHCEAAARGAETDAEVTIVVLSPADGTVLAVVGGREDKTASLIWNRALSSPRQPGSTIKVVGQYAAALESGAATLATVYDDAPTAYTSGVPIRNAGGAYLGRTTVREAVARSLNTVALRCFQSVGLDAVWGQLEQFGFAHLDEADRVEALALGGTHGGVTNLELTAAYAAIGNGGVWTEPRFYTRILNRDGTVLIEKPAHTRQVVRPDTAALLTSAMEDVLTAGTGREAAFDGASLAGKSGTTTERRDLWFVGFSPVLACGVWGGYDDYSPQTTSAPVKVLWREVMEYAHRNRADSGFPHTADLERRTVCAKCGQLAVSGLCDSTVQGNMAREEWFAPGTAPVLKCNCHVKTSYCKISGDRAGLYCRERTEQVYLREGTPDTADETALDPGGPFCTLHTHWTDWLFPEEKAEEEAELPPPPEPRPEGEEAVPEPETAEPAEEIQTGEAPQLQAGRWKEWFDWDRWRARE